VVETAVGRPRRLLGAAVALLAVGLLAAMVVSGHLRESKQFVKFVPAGVMPEAAAEIDRVEIRSSAGQWVFERAPGGWRTPDGRPVPATLAAHLDDSIKFMHVAAPIRVMERAEWAPLGLREFGLDRPSYAATLYRRGVAVLEAEFGAPNPQKVLQYMKLEGRDEVYLMPRFIGDEWKKALREAAAG
jgi:hypothetical protein